MADEAPRPSFDPRSWTRPVTPGAAPPLVAGPAVLSTAGRLPFLSPPMLGALGGSVALLVLGGIAAHLARPAPGSPQAVAQARTAEARRIEAQRTLILSGPQELLGALTANGVTPDEAQRAAQAAAGALKPGGEIRAAMTLERQPDGALRLGRLEASNADSSGAVVSAADGGFRATPVAANLTSRIVVRRGTMDAEDFYSSAVAAGVTDSLIPDFAKALAFDFDFQREVHRGDAFEAAFEQPVDPQGNPVGAPRLLFASLMTPGKSAQVYRFRPPGEAEGWFDGTGRSIVRALLRTPVDGARVSSAFGMRVHPIFGFMKMHKGIDFAAPIGTPIYASGSGVVEVASPSASAGNWAILKHENGWETVYMHMNHYAPGIAVGAHVAQGQQIGEVGTTGHSTGPHLHYELHIGGEAVDPLGVRMEGGKVLGGPALDAFTKERDRIDVNRARGA